MAFEDLRGKAGTVVVSKGRSGLVIRPRKSGANPRTAPQEAIRSQLARAAVAYRALTPAQVQAWKNYAKTIVKVNPVNGQTYNPAANSLFCGLAAKLLQVNPNASIPTAPPSSSFTGDSIPITATAGVGKITFSTTQANSTGVVTELLLQPLASPNRTPTSRGYRTKAFQAFAIGNLSREIAAPPGFYAAAYRFVKTATGQATNLIPLNITQVTLALADDDPQSSAPEPAAAPAATSASGKQKRKAA
jgi:hypothetical protein